MKIVKFTGPPKRFFSLVSRTGVLTACICLGGICFAQTPQYIGNEQCKICHNKATEGEQWNKWKAGVHAHALETLKGDVAKDLAAKKGLATPPAESAECVRCHVTAYNAATKTTPAKIKMADSIQCESCHGPGSEHAKDGKELLFKKGSKSPIDVKAHLAAISEQVCVQCHNPESVTWNPEKYTLADGSKSGFDFKQAAAKNEHPNPLKPKTK